MSQLPVDPQKNRGGPSDRSGAQILNIGSYHYYGNDLKKIRKIADSDTDVANKLVDNSDKHGQRAF